MLQVFIFLITGPCGLVWLLSGRARSIIGNGLCRGLGPCIAHLLFAYGVRHFGGGAEEVEILADWSGHFSASAAAKGVVIESIICLVKPVTQPIVGVFEVDARSLVSVIRRTPHNRTYASSSASSKPCCRPRESPSKGSAALLKPGASAGWPRARGMELSSPKNDMFEIQTSSS